jgi:putative inorganic carbon (hco3(-)) transporter
MTFALFILYVVLSYIHPGELVPALASYRVAYWAGIAGLAGAIASLLMSRSSLLANLQLRVLVVFAAVMGVSLMVADRWLGAPILAMQRFGPSLTTFVLAICGVTSLTRLRIAAGCVIVLTTILALEGAAAYHFGHNTRMFLIDRATRSEDPAAAAAQGEDQADPNLIDQVSDDIDDADEAENSVEWEQPRIQGLGLMHDPNDLALGMIVGLGLIAGALKGRMARLHLRNMLLAAAAGALVYGIYLTRSRGGALALVVVLWRFAAGRVGRVPALVLLVALGAGALALDFGGRSLSVQPDESASERLVAWTEGLEMLKAQPILGVGYGQFLDHHTLTAHNSLVLCFAETGLLGCFFWVGLFVVTLLELRGLKSLSGDEPFDDLARQWAEGLQLSLIGFMVAAFFLSRTFVPTLYLIIGLSAALAAVARGANRSVTLPALPELVTLVLGCELGGIAVVYTIVKLHLA